MSVLMRRIFAVFLFLLLAVAGSRATLARAQEPTQEELRALVERIVANQHRNDDALAEYERRERVVARKSGEQERIVEDKTFRVFPTGTGTIRVLLEEKGRPVKRGAYEKGLRYVEQALVDALNPDLSRQKEAVAKWEKRTRERRELVDAVPQAFLVTWLGRETRNGRTLAKLRFEPNPEFKPASRNAELFTHVSAVLWVDEKEAQVARIESEISRDIGVFGGVFGKVYKGGTFVLEQAQVADGIWLPVRYEFDYGGRRFVFPFAVNETTETGTYRRIGSPREALAAVRRELQSAGGAGPVKSGTANGSR
jgi:hypothetical protein